jgi:hypothetical protein
MGWHWFSWSFVSGLSSQLLFHVSCSQASSQSRFRGFRFIALSSYDSQAVNYLRMISGRISLSCNLSLAPGFSPVGAGDAAPSRFNGFVAAGAENG